MATMRSIRATISGVVSAVWTALRTDSTNRSSEPPCRRAARTDLLINRSTFKCESHAPITDCHSRMSKLVSKVAVAGASELPEPPGVPEASGCVTV